MEGISIFNIINLIGGLAIFLFGMTLMGEALERRAGNQLKNVLSKLTTNKYKGFLLGLIVTAIIQSSSATTVMVVGFVNSGIMVLRQAINVIMGANIGTTATTWLLSLIGIEGDAWFVQILKPTSFTPILALIGCIMYCFINEKKKKHTGLILLGFSVLIFGMDMMSEAVKPLAEVEGFRNILLLFSNPILGVLAGAILTSIIQSSSASVGILQMLSASGAVTMGSAIPIIMGQNIGTCVTAMISSVGANKNARRAALVHLYFNILGTIVWLMVFSILNYIFSFAFVNQAATPFTIAIAHTAFNILSTALLFPFTKQLEWLAVRSIPDKKDKSEEIKLLDARLLATPSVAVNRSRTVAVTMANTSVETFKQSMTILKAYDKDLAEKIREGESKVDDLEDMIGSYLVKLSGRNLSEDNSQESYKLLHLLNDFERISDHAVNLLESAEEIHEKQLIFSDEAKKEISVMMEAVNEILDLALRAFVDNDLQAAHSVEPLEEVIDFLKSKLKTQHIKRLQRNECTIELGFVLTDIVTNLERVADHCSNIAGLVIEVSQNSFDMHNFLKTIKRDPGSEFARLFETYMEKYTIDAD